MKFAILDGTDWDYPPFTSTPNPAMAMRIPSWLAPVAFALLLLPSAALAEPTSQVLSLIHI